jgi:hypothetical protein
VVSKVSERRLGRALVPPWAGNARYTLPRPVHNTFTGSPPPPPLHAAPLPLGRPARATAARSRLPRPHCPPRCVRRCSAPTAPRNAAGFSSTAMQTKLAAQCHPRQGIEHRSARRTASIAVTLINDNNTMGRIIPLVSLPASAGLAPWPAIRQGSSTRRIIPAHPCPGPRRARRSRLKPPPRPVAAAARNRALRAPPRLWGPQAGRRALPLRSRPTTALVSLPRHTTETRTPAPPANLQLVGFGRHHVDIVSGSWRAKRQITQIGSRTAYFGPNSACRYSRPIPARSARLPARMPRRAEPKIAVGKMACHHHYHEDGRRCYNPRNAA